MKFVQENPGGDTGIAVDRCALPDMFLHVGHDQLFQSLTQLADVVADHAVIQVHVRPVVQIG